MTYEQITSILLDKGFTHSKYDDNTFEKTYNIYYNRYSQYKAFTVNIYIDNDDDDYETSTIKTR